MNFAVRSLSLAAVGMMLAACGPTGNGAKPEVTAVSDEVAVPGLTLAAVQPGTTWVAYEIKKEGITLVPSYCAAEPSLLFSAPTIAAQNGVCVFRDKFNNGNERGPAPDGEIMGFNPPGSSGRISDGASVRIEDNGAEPRVFQLFSVAPGRYYPALVGFQQSLKILPGFAPYFDVKAGKVNYIGSYNVPLGADVQWEPEAFAKAIATQPDSLSPERINVEPPLRAKITCLEANSKNLLDVSFLKGTRCFVSDPQGSYFR